MQSCPILTMKGSNRPVKSFESDGRSKCSNRRIHTSSFLIPYLGEILKIAKNVKNYLKISFAMLFMNYPIRNRHSERIRFHHTMSMLMSTKLKIHNMPESQCHQGWCHREHNELEQKEGNQLRNRLKIMMRNG